MIQHLRLLPGLMTTMEIFLTEVDNAEGFRFETQPDDQGFKTITDIQFRDGKKIKITKKVKVVKKTLKVNTRAEERLRNWKKFGKAAGANDPSITVTDRDPTPFDISGKKKTQTEKKIEQEIEKMMRQAKEGPESTGRFVPKSMRPGGKATSSTTTATDAKSQKDESNAYRPPSHRTGGEGGRGATMSSRDETTHTVRVTNLSEDITEQDLRDLFGTYGPLQRVFLAKDRISRESKGFAFINFHNKSDAERAIEKVSGFGYNHLILQVEWAKK